MSLCCLQTFVGVALTSGHNTIVLVPNIRLDFCRRSFFGCRLAVASDVSSLSFFFCFFRGDV